MDEQQFKELLKAYQQGRLDDATRRQVEAWYASFGYHTAIEPLEDEQKAGKIYQELSKSLSEYTKSQPRERGKQQWWHYVAAASIVLGLAIGAVFSYLPKRPSALQHASTAPQPDFDTLYTEAGKLKRLLLPDNSEVWLNANSRIRYSQTSFKTSRSLFLDYGEAFFKVTTDHNRPFEVHAPGMHTRVLGTSFSVKSYPELDYAMVSVKTGKVRVSAQDEQNGNMLEAGMGLKMDKATGLFTRDDHFAADADSWVRGFTLLNEATFEELAMVFYNRFRIRLRTSLPQAGNFRYTMRIKQDKSVDETMRLICAVHQTHYRRNGNEVIIY